MIYHRKPSKELLRTKDAVSLYIQLDITADKKFNLAVKTRCVRRKNDSAGRVGNGRDSLHSPELRRLVTPTLKLYATKDKRWPHWKSCL